MADTTSPLSPSFSVIPPSETNVTPPMAPPASASSTSAPPTAMGGTPTPTQDTSATPSAAAGMGGGVTSSQISSLGAPPNRAVPTGAGGPTQSGRQFNLSAEDQKALAFGHAQQAAHDVMDPEKSKPGSIWRTILSAALVGAAAGAGHGWQGMGAGAEAQNKVMERQRQAQLDAQKEARENRRDTLAETKEKREQSAEERAKTIAESTIAFHHQEIIASQANIDHMTRQEAEERNKASQAMIDAFKARGATDPTDPGVPPVISAYSLRDRIAKGDNQVLHPLDTSRSRIFFDTVKHSEIKQNDKGEWVDKNGALEDMTGHVQLQVLDVPTKTLETKSPMSNKDLAAIAGKEFLTGRDPEGTTSVSGLDIIALSKNKRSDALAERQTKAQELLAQGQARANDLAAVTEASKAYTSLYATVHGANEELKSQAAAEIDPIKRQKINDEINQNSKNLLTSYYSMFPRKKGQAPLQQAPPPPAPADTSTALGLLKTVKGYVSDDSKPVLEKYIAGANSYDQFVSTLSAAQASLPDATKIPLTEYRSLLSAGKSYYDNLPKVKQKTAQEDTARKLDTIRAKHPEDNITAADLNEYDDTGDRIITPDLT